MTTSTDSTENELYFTCLRCVTIYRQTIFKMPMSHDTDNVDIGDAIYGDIFDSSSYLY